MGKVFDCTTGENMGYIPFADGLLMKWAQRIEMDDDTDAGFATVTALYPVGPNNAPLPTPDGTEAVRVTFRAHVQMIPKDRVTDAMRANALHFSRYKKLKSVDGKIVPDGWVHEWEHKGVPNPFDALKDATCQN